MNTGESGLNAGAPPRLLDELLWGAWALGGALVALAAGVAEVAFAGGAAAGVAVDARVLRTGRLLGDVVGL